MEPLPDYLQKNCEVLRKTVPQEISEEDIEILILLIHENYSQRNLAKLLSRCFNLNYSYVLNMIYGVGTNKGERNRKRLEELKNNLKENEFVGEVCG